jgi:Putative Ig domain
MLMRKSIRGTSNLFLAVALSGSILLAGCYDEEQSKNQFSSGGSAISTPSGTPTGTTANQAPSIKGTAPAQVTVGEEYYFKPSASDADGDPLSFTAAGVPAWLTFDPGTGRISGTPTAADVATYSGIRITVSDGKAKATLRIARLDVVQGAAQGSPGSATLEWEAPLANADGSALRDLAGYNIRYGTSPGALDHLVEVRNPGLTTYVVDGLSPTTWYFSISSVNADGIESQSTGLVWTTIG